MFRRTKFEERFDYEYMYPTTHDAVLHICHRKTSRNPSPANKKKNEEKTSDLNLNLESNNTSKRVNAEDSNYATLKVEFEIENDSF